MNGHWIGWAEWRDNNEVLYAAEFSSISMGFNEHKGKQWTMKCFMNFWNVYDIAKKSRCELNQNLIARLSGNLCKIPFDSSMRILKNRWKGYSSDVASMNIELVNPQRIYFILQDFERNKIFKRFSFKNLSDPKSAHSIVHDPCARRSLANKKGMFFKVAW